MKKCNWLITLFILQSIFSVVSGQTPSTKLLFNYLTIEEGLPNNKVNSIARDDLGFIWIATNDGMSRFDGLEVKSYGLTDYSLSDNQVRTSLVNQVLIVNGEIIIGAYTLFYYNKTTDKFEKYPFRNKTVPLKRIRTIEQDSKNRIWIGDGSGLYSIDPKDKDSLIAYPFSDKEKIDINSILSLGDSLLIGTRNKGMFVFDVNNQSYSPFLPFYTKESKNIALCLFKEEETIWIGTENNGIFKVNLNDLSIDHIYLDPDNIYSKRIRDFVKDDIGNLWIGSRGGLYIKYAITNEIQLCATIDHPYSKLSSNSIYDILIDSNQNIWLGTFSGGVNYANLKRKPFSFYNAKTKSPKSLSDKVVTCFCESDNGDIYIGTDGGGINLFDRKKEEFTYYVQDSNNPNSLVSNDINAIVRENSGNMWIGTNLGLSYYKVENNRFQKFLHNPDDSNSINNNKVNCLAIDKDQNLWIGTTTGIDYLKFGEYNFKHIFKGKITFFYQNKEGKLWAGTYGDGIYLFNSITNTFERYFESFINSSVRTMLIDSENNLWAGGNKGIVYVNTSDSTRHYYTTLNGLPTNLIMGILEDEHKNIWVSTSAGLIKSEDAVLFPDSLNFRKFTLTDGIQSDQFYQYAYMKSSTNEMFFGGINGFNVFNPELIQENNVFPKLAFTGLKIFNKIVQVGQEIEGKVVLSKPLAETQNINLTYKHNVITFDFIALHYSNPKQNKYRYKLMPLEKEWNYTTADRSDATYTNLNGGNYTFMVEAANSDGLWSKDQLMLSVKVSPPFWKTIWFISLEIIFLIVIIVSYYLYRIALLKKYSKALEKEVSDRTQELQAQKEALIEVNLMKDKLFSIIAHDLKSPFQGLLGFTDILESEFYKTDDIKKFSYVKYISQSANNIFNLLTNLLTWSRAQTSKVSFIQNKLDLHKIIAQNIMLLHNNYEKKSINLNNRVKNNVIVWADKDMLETILRNILSNAIKFTPINGEIFIDSIDIGSMIQVSIKDTGIGIPKEDINNLFALDKSVSRSGTIGESGTGLGLLICKDFVEKNGGKIWVKSESKKGSTFYFTLLKPDNKSS